MYLLNNSKWLAACIMPNSMWLRGTPALIVGRAHGVGRVFMHCWSTFGIPIGSRPIAHRLEETKALSTIFAMSPSWLGSIYALALLVLLLVARSAVHVCLC